MGALRVAFVLEQCWHRVPGGTASSALGTARALQDVADVTCIGVSARHRAVPPRPWTPPVRVAAMPLPRPLLYECWHGLRWPAVQRATGPVDVIHATGMAIPPKSAPLVVTVHDLAFVDFPAHATRHGLRFFRRSLALTRRDADLVLCPSEATKREVLDAGIEASRVRVVPWGVELVDVTADDVERVRSRYDTGTRFVLWVGTVEPRKNIGLLTDAFRRLRDRDVRLVLAGPDGWNETLARHLDGLESNVRALGFVPADDLPALYAAASVFCYPSLREGFGIPVLEAMAAGAPVVTAKGTATEEVAGDAGICVDPRDAAALADALAAVLDDPARASSMRAAGRARAATFTWARTAELTAAAYREVAR